MEPDEEPTEEQTTTPTQATVEPEPTVQGRVDWDSQPLEEARRLGRYFEKKEGVASKGELRYRRTLRDREQELAELKAELDAAKAKSMHPADWRIAALEFAVAAEGLAVGAGKKSAREIAQFLEPRADIRDGQIRIAGANGKFLPSVRLALMALDPDLLAPIYGSGGQRPNEFNVATQTADPLRKVLDSQKAFEAEGKSLGVRK
jgi:hypothetical protein